MRRLFQRRRERAESRQLPRRAQEAEDARRLLAESRAETRKLRADADAAREHHGHLRARLEDARRASRRAEEDAARLAAELDAERAEKKRLRVNTCGASASRARNARGTQKFASRAREELEELRGAHKSVARVEAENRRLVAKLANLRARAAATKETDATEAEAHGGRQGVTLGVTETAARRRATPSEVAAALLAAETEPSSTEPSEPSSTEPLSCTTSFVGVRPGSGGNGGGGGGGPAPEVAVTPEMLQAFMTKFMRDVTDSIETDGGAGNGNAGETTPAVTPELLTKMAETFMLERGKRTDA